MYLLVKYAHILSMVLLFGTGLGSAFYKWMADRSKNISVIAQTNRHVVLADWIFTTPTVVLQPLSGLWMVSQLGISLSTPWIAWSLLLYFFAGACWLPVVWLQIKMRNLSEEAQETGQDLPPLYWRYTRYWLLLGIPAFISMVAVVFLMVFKPTGF